MQFVIGMVESSRLNTELGVLENCLGRLFAEQFPGESNQMRIPYAKTLVPRVCITIDSAGHWVLHSNDPSLDASRLASMIPRLRRELDSVSYSPPRSALGALLAS